MKRVGIVTGVPQEGDAFRPDLLRTALGGLPPIQSVEHAGKHILLASAGLGKVAAATAAALLVMRHGAEFLLVIGTAGRIAEGDGHVFLIDEAVQADYGARRTDSMVHYTAGHWPIGPATLDCFRAAPTPDIGLPRARIATSDLFIECGIHAASVRDAAGATLIDMEVGAVAQAAALLGVPWAAIKATTDDANGDSAASFEANLAAAARTAAEAAERLIERL